MFKLTEEEATSMSSVLPEITVKRIVALIDWAGKLQSVYDAGGSIFYNVMSYDGEEEFQTRARIDEEEAWAALVELDAV